MKGLLFVYGMTYGGSAVALVNPYAGLLIYICFAIVRPESMWFWSVPPGNYSRVIAIALLIGWALRGCGDWRLGRARLPTAALVGFWLWSAARAASAEDTTVAVGFVEDISKIVLPFLVGITTINSTARLKQLVWVILLSQGYVAYELNMTYFHGYNRLWEEGFGGMDNNCNGIALVTCIGLAFFFGLFAPHWWQRVLALVAAAFLANAIFFSFSRGAMVALALVGLVAFWLMPKRPQYYLIFALGAAAALRLAGPQVVERFATVFADKDRRDESAASRIELWSACCESMAKEPLGIGPAHWPLVAHEYGFRRGKLAHTLWLQIGAELGFPGLFALLLFYLSCMVRLWPYARGRAGTADPWFRYLACMVIASLTGFVVSAQFVSLYGLEVPYYVVLLGSGVLRLDSLPGLAPSWPAPAAVDLAVRPVLPAS